MNAWISKPTEPGLYLYKSDREKTLPLEFDGERFWIRLPEGSRPSGQRAIMFRPAGGMFWRIPDPPAFPRWETARADCNGRFVAGGGLGGGSSFEIREAVKEPPYPITPLMKIESSLGVPAGTIIAHYVSEDGAAKIINITPDPEIDPHMPLSGRWGWGKGFPECPPAMFKPFRCIDAMKDPISGKITERAHAFEQDPDIHYPESEICKCGFHKTHPIHGSAPDAT